MSREFSDGLVFQPQVVQEAVQIIRNTHLNKKQRKNSQKAESNLKDEWQKLSQFATSHYNMCLVQYIAIACVS